MASLALLSLFSTASYDAVEISVGLSSEMSGKLSDMSDCCTASEAHGILMMILAASELIKGSTVDVTPTHFEEFIKGSTVIVTPTHFAESPENRE